ncbi:MAG: alpha/beta hydrolase [Jiangellales bacterium]
MVDRLALARSAAALGAGGFVAATGAAVGFATERYVMGRALGGHDPYANEPLGGLRGTPYALETSDGVQLHVEMDGGDEPGPTIVLAHGYALNHDCWHFQRRDLRATSRLVLYDQRSHGRSGRAPSDETSIRRLGIDLGEVIDHVVPPGPVVVVGHSMGGMSVMSLADQRPELFGERIVGVGLIATSAVLVRANEMGLRGRANQVLHRYGPAAVATAAKQPDLLESVRRTGNDLGYVLTKRFSFARNDISPSLVEFVAAMVAGTPVGVIADFLPQFGAHDTRRALAGLDRVETLVLGAGGDQMTPVQHSRDIVAAVPSADYVEIPDAGHMVMLEHPELVTAHLRSLLARSTRETAHPVDDPGAVPVPLPRPSRRARRGRSRRS